MDVYIFFVDFISKEVYGNYLDVLNGFYDIQHGDGIIMYPYPFRDVIYFHTQLQKDDLFLAKAVAVAMSVKHRKLSNHPEIPLSA